MQLIINTYGAYLRKNGNCFLVKNDDMVHEVAVGKVESIMITTGASLSTDALEFALQNNIDVVLLDRHGNPYGRVWHTRLGSTTLIRRRQLEASEATEGLALAKEWVVRKLDNQTAFIEKLKKPREDKSVALETFQMSIHGMKLKIESLSGDIEERRASLMAFEGVAGRAYFEALGLVMPERFRFEGRSRNPARDEFNAMLNYAYGVLYSLVEKSCIVAGLDPYIGFIHTDDYNKKSLVFDIIEMFRIFADEPVVHLFTGRKVKAGFFDGIRGGVVLNREGKALLIGALNAALDESVRYHGRNIQRRNAVQFECHRIANGLLRDADMDSV